MFSEHKEQVYVMQWCDVQMSRGRFPELRWLHAIPNGADVSKKERSKLIKEGLKSGVADLFLPCQRRLYAGLYIEMKKVSGKDASKRQKEFRDFVIQQGYAWHLCYGAPEAVKILEWYLMSEKTTYGVINP